MASMRQVPPRAPPRPGGGGGPPSYNGKYFNFSLLTFNLKRNNYDFLGAKRAAPARPREQPPSLPRSPSPLGSMSSLHDVLKVNSAPYILNVKTFVNCV